MRRGIGLSASTGNLPIVDAIRSFLGRHSGKTQGKARGIAARLLDRYLSADSSCVDVAAHQGEFVAYFID